MKNRLKLALSVLAVAAHSLSWGNSQTIEKGPAWVDKDRLLSVDPANWYSTRRGWTGDHYSPVSQINESNIDNLGFAWEFQTFTNRGLEASPVVVDGVMDTSGNWGWVSAVDAAACKVFT